jgi:chromate transporter
MQAAGAHDAPSLAELAREWGRIGCVGFGGPPAHVALLRNLCVSERAWLDDQQFERAIAATSLLPGPGSTQLAIYCAWRLRGGRGALVGGLAFVLPGLLAIIALSAVFLAGSPPAWIRGAGMGAGAAVAPVALLAGIGVAIPIWRRTAHARRMRATCFLLAGILAASLTGPWLVLVLVGCGGLELAWRGLAARGAGGLQAFAPVAAHLAGLGGAGSLAWVAFKVGALAFGGGFVIVPLMQTDAVSTYHWMSHGQFAYAVALGQLTPGPITHTVAAVGYAAGGVPGALLAALVGFSPSFSFVLLGATRFERLLRDERVVAFLAGAAPAAAGAIIGSAVPLVGALGQTWQYFVLGAAALALLVLRRGVVATLLGAGAFGALAAVLGAPVAH